LTRRRYKLKSIIETRAERLTRELLAKSWDQEALVVDTVSLQLMTDYRYPEAASRKAAQAAWDNTETQPPN
jgi:hypothetical protein